MSFQLNRENAHIFINEKCSDLANRIEANSDGLIDLLLKYESYETAKDEVWRSIDCLRNISKEIEWLSYGKVNLMCSFFPINLPLYSLVIFAIVPGFMATEIIVRPPILVRKILLEIWDIIGCEEVINNIKFVDLERSLFNEAYVSIADVVIFTGRYENAKVVQSLCPHALFIFNGAGVNPIIVSEYASLDLAVDKIVEARVFNSGQDCHGPDLIFVHEKIELDFQQKLLEKIKEIKVGDYHDRDVQIGHLIDVDILTTAQSFFENKKDSIIYGGNIDLARGIIYPTVIKDRLQVISLEDIIEFFSPIFYLLIYKDIGELNIFFSKGSYSDLAMYTSIFSENIAKYDIPNTIILQNKILNDVERGNDPFGGYGPKANYATYDDIYYYRPILISCEIFTYLQYVNSNT